MIRIRSIYWNQNHTLSVYINQLTMDTSATRVYVINGVQFMDCTISYVPISFKHNLVHCLLNREISSSFKIFKQEVGVIKNILISNGYSYNFINKHVKHFLNRQNASDNTFTQIPTFGPEFRKVFIQLPY